jgi:branched-subunit amino acid ABC-type transport system permease component
MTLLSQLIVNSLIAGSILALIAFGLSITYNFLRILNFAHAHFMMAGAYSFYFLLEIQKLPPVVAGLGSLVFVSLFALFSYRLFVAPFKKYNFSLVIITTLVLAMIMEALAALFFGSGVKSIYSEWASHTWSIKLVAGNTIYITRLQTLIIASAAALLLSIASLIYYTPLGRKLRAISQDEAAASSLGVNTTKWSYWIYTLSCLIAGFTGIVVAHEVSFQPTMGGLYIIRAFAAMILGGLGNLWGTVIGAYLLAFVENLSMGLQFDDFRIPASFRDAFAYVIILICLLWRPQGIFGKAAREV